MQFQVNGQVEASVQHRLVSKKSHSQYASSTITQKLGGGNPVTELFTSNSEEW